MDNALDSTISNILCSTFGGNKKDPIPDWEDCLGVLGVPDGVPLLSFANLPPRLVAVLWLQHGACKARSHFQTSGVQPGEYFKSNSQVMGCLAYIWGRIEPEIDW